MVDGLLDFIAGGSAPERRLPVERALCEQLHVSRSTVREALSTLAQLGVVVTRGKGRYGSLVGARAELARRERGRRVRTELIDHPLEARRMRDTSNGRGGRPLLRTLRRVAGTGSYAGSNLSATQAHSTMLRAANQSQIAPRRTPLLGLWSRWSRVRAPSLTPFTLLMTMFVSPANWVGVPRGV